MIDHDRERSRHLPMEERTTAPPADVAARSVFGSLGLAFAPFATDAGAGPFVPTATQTSALATIDAWWQGDPAGSLALLTGAAGGGVSRTLLEFRQRIDAPAAIVRILPDPGGKRSDAQLLKDAIVTFGAEPTGRTGLELQGTLRQVLDRLAADGQRPLLAIDGGQLGGSQLEILRSLLTGSPAAFLVAGRADLAVRVARRRSLAADTRATIAIDALTDHEITDLVTSRLVDADGSDTLLAPDARDALIALAAGVPGTAIAIMRGALQETVARGAAAIDGAAVMTAWRAIAAADTEDATTADLAIQTRIPLPGFEDVATPRRRRGRSQGGE